MKALATPLRRGTARCLRSTQACLSSSTASSDNPTNFDKILIANRGEIACRVMKTCQEMGIKTVAIHSQADTNNKHVLMADEAVCVGPAASGESYLQIDRIVEAVKMTGAKAVHPGFGFLSENNAFAKALEDNNVAFCGPGSFAIEIMGDKIASKEFAMKAGVNVIPGDNRVIKDDVECVEVSNQVGYPVMIKASAGGGGKGMRVAYDDDGARIAFRLSTAEAISSFGDDRIFIEKFVEEPRHIEIQVLADSHGNVIYLNERECSIQRRNQKVIEEAPSVPLDAELRAAMGKQACDLARACDYVSAGTVEFLVDKHKNFYFLEMNTRLQVEHPVTEYITGVDLVREMIRVAGGLPLDYAQEDIGINGWSIESRIYAEDPYKGFLPSTGLLHKYKEPLPDDPHVRCDSGILDNSEISVHYDPMICKLVTWGEDRAAAIAKMADALDNYVIHGVNHNIPFVRALMDHPRFKSGDITTNFIPEEWPTGEFENPELDDTAKNQLVATAAGIHSSYVFPEEVFDNVQQLIITLEDEKFEVDFDPCSRTLRINGGEWFAWVSDYERGADVMRCQINDDEFVSQLIRRENPHTYVIQQKGIQHKIICRRPNEERMNQYVPKPVVIDHDRMFFAPMPGTLISIGVKPGDTVVAGQEMCIIEAMKMQNVFYAQKDGVCKAVHFDKGTTVEGDALIYELE